MHIAMDAKKQFSTIADILLRFDPLKDKYISREYQAFGVHLAEKLLDLKRISMYVKFAKTMPRPILEQALRFVSDSKAKNMAALFMWKLKELGALKGPIIKEKKVRVKKERVKKVKEVAEDMFGE
jgi:hypothetical protein